MIMADTLQTLKKIIAEKLDRDPESITPESTMEDIGLDSLDTFDVIFRAEEEFNIKVTDYQAELKTLQDVVNLLDQLIKEQHPT
jgi:acyl carrier protein